MSWSIFLFVSSLKINETIHSIRIKQWVQQKQNITHRYGSTKKELKQQTSTIVSISHRYGSTTVFTAFSVFIIPHFPYFSIFFSKKVGQPLHSKFPQSLDSTGFFIFAKIDSEVQRLFDCFLLFSALFHAVFVLEALILLGWRFNDFFYRIFNNLCFNQRKSFSPLTKTEASFEYLNHTHDPAFAVHPCPSPIFCHQEDKSELRGATPHFLPRLTPKPAQEWLPANFTVHSDFSSLFLPYGYFHRLLPL